jgi:hypothetical protein
VPLDKTGNWKTELGLTDAEKTEAGYSYDRTMKLLKNGMETINTRFKTKTDSYIAEFKAAQLNKKDAA